VDFVLDTQRIKKGEEIVGQLKGTGAGIKRSKQVSTRRGVGAGWSLLQRLAPPDITTTLDSILSDQSTQEDALSPLKASNLGARPANSNLLRPMSTAIAKAEMDAARRAENTQDGSFDEGADNSFADVMNLVREGSGRR